MRCPNCRHDNFEGEDSCENCGADLSAAGVPQALDDFHDTILGDHLGALDISAPTFVEPSMPAAAAIKLMHENGIDCLVVCDEGHLVGIFTDRDAAVKAVDKRLGLFRVRDFMTPDPVVLRRDDTLAVAIHKMAVGGFRHIPVVDDDRPIGILSAADVFRYLVASLG